MRRTNLCTKPAETIGAMDGDPNNWKDFENGSGMSLQPGQYVASCNVTEIGSKGGAIQCWDAANHLEFVDLRKVAIGVNVIQLDIQTASDSCHFAVCDCRATDFIVERADTYDTAAGGGFRASSPRRPHHTSPVKAGGRS